MSDYDIHSCGYYCDRHACIVAQRNELRDKLFSDQAVKTYSGGKPNYTQPIVRITTPEDIAKIKSKWEPTIDGWPLWSGLPQPEPVAYINVEERKLEWATPIKWETPTVVKMDKVPLYTTPQKREWHELTDGEIATIKTKYEFGVNSHSFINAVRELETWLKERNNG
jgi:hypothetical protein